MNRSFLGRNRTRGFTLLELLIAIAVLGLVMVALSGGLQFTTRAWETQTRIIGERGDRDAVQNVLRELLTSARHFDGDGASLSFTGRLPRALKLGGLFDIRLQAAGDRLMLSWRPHLPGAFAPPLPATEVLAGNLARLAFAYYVPGGEDEGGWLMAVSPKVKPSLIMVAVSADGRNWPPLVVPAMIE